MNKTNTRRALFLSLVSLLLCFSMMLGTTFAWFTDSVSVKQNRIVAGNLDVELFYDNASTTGFENVTKANAKMFVGADGEEILWEPGAVAYTNFEIRNIGNLALKYAMNVVVTDETTTTVDGEVLSLEDVIKVAVLPGETVDSREAAIAKANASGIKFSEIATNGDLLPTGEVDDCAVILYWAPNADDVDNKYNLNNNRQGDDALDITFDIRLTATQLTHEEDSFGDDYDEDAVFGTLVKLNDGDDLMAALSSAEAGKPVTIKLLGDVEWPTPEANNSDITAASSVLIDGNGHTITATGNGVYAIGDNDAPIIFRNLDMVDESFYIYENGENAWEFTYLELSGNNRYENVKFTDGIMVEGGKNTFVDCEFIGHNNDSSDRGNITMNGVWVYSGDATFTNCSFTGTRGMKICDMYSGGEVGTVVIDNCSFIGLSEKPGIAIDDCDTQDMNITIKNSRFIKCQPGDQGLYIYETDNTIPTLENNIVDNETAVVADKATLTSAISNAQPGDTVIFTADVDYGAAQLTIDEDITVDLNGKELTSSNGHIGFVMKNGSIKNGTVNYNGNVGAISVRGSLGSIEDVEINVTPKEGKTITGIQLVNGSARNIESIKNVTITGATQGIEVKDCSPNNTTTYAIGTMENVTIDATDVGMIINGYIGEIKNCDIKGGNIGINMMLKGEYKVAAELVDCIVTGSVAGIWAHDEVGISNTNNCSFTLTYDAATEINGGLNWDFEDECQSVVTLNAPANN